MRRTERRSAAVSISPGILILPSSNLALRGYASSSFEAEEKLTPSTLEAPKRSAALSANCLPSPVWSMAARLRRGFERIEKSAASCSENGALRKVLTSRV